MPHRSSIPHVVFIAIMILSCTRPKSNHPPIAYEDIYTVFFNATGMAMPVRGQAASDGLLFNDFDTDGDTLFVPMEEETLTLPMKHGEVVIHSDGSFVYTPKTGPDHWQEGVFACADSFSYPMTDGKHRLSTIVRIVPGEFRAGKVDRSGSGPGGFMLAGGSIGDLGNPKKREIFDWFIGRADQGDMVLLSASDSPGPSWNEFSRDLWNTYGPDGSSPLRLNSVTSFVITTREQAALPRIAMALRSAEAIFIEGGDQAAYLDLWVGTPIQTELNRAITGERSRPRAVLGGTSAGMAVLGQYTYDCPRWRDPGVTSKEACSDPMHPWFLNLFPDFVRIPGLEGVVTDTHFGARDRLGRTIVFLAKLRKEMGVARPKSIAVDEATAVCIDPEGNAKVIGAGCGYFLTADEQSVLETFESGKPLTFTGVLMVRMNGQEGSFRVAPGIWQNQGGTEFRVSVKNGKLPSDGWKCGNTP